MRERPNRSAKSLGRQSRGTAVSIAVRVLPSQRRIHLQPPDLLVSLHHWLLAGITHDDDASSIIPPDASPSRSPPSRPSPPRPTKPAHATNRDVYTPVGFSPPRSLLNVSSCTLRGNPGSPGSRPSRNRTIQRGENPRAHQVRCALPTDRSAHIHNRRRHCWHRIPASHGKGMLHVFSRRSL